jgi:hypothetical protein
VAHSFLYPRIRPIASLVTALAVLLCTASVSAYPAQLPERISDEEFRKLISTLSEPGGSFQSENLLSNETDFPQVMARLKDTVSPGGVYMGVGPEQNFNYIAAIQPRLAFIIDIRRQNMIEHFLYKALFELSLDRADFIARLFSRKQPPGLTSDSTAAELFDAYQEVTADDTVFEKNLRDVENRLIGVHHLEITREDRLALRNVYAAFREFGPLINYNSRGGGFGGLRFMPSYADLMTQIDGSGREWSYLASEENYRVVRDLELRNLIVPLTGDFGGLKAIRAVGQYVKDQGALISAFYTSNVEGYLFQGGDRTGNPNGGAAKFYGNVSTLPLDKTSTFIRWIPRWPNTRRGDASIRLASIIETLEEFESGKFSEDNLLPAYGDRFGRGPGGGFVNAQRNLPSGKNFSAYDRYLRIGSYFLAAAAFLIRLLIWRPNGRERIPSMRTILYSAAWAVGGYVLGAGIAALIRFLSPS